MDRLKLNKLTRYLLSPYTTSSATVRPTNLAKQQLGSNYLHCVTKRKIYNTVFVWSLLFNGRKWESLCIKKQVPISWMLSSEWLYRTCKIHRQEALDYERTCSQWGLQELTCQLTWQAVELRQLLFIGIVLLVELCATISINFHVLPYFSSYVCMYIPP